MRVFGTVRIKRLLLVLTGLGGSFAAGWFLLQSVTTSALSVEASNAIFVVEQVVADPGEALPGVELPYQIMGTNLIAQRLCAYEGPYLEDGSGEEVVNIAALLITNVAPTGTECAQVTLRWQQGEYVFDADMVPAGASVLVLERDRKSYLQQDWTTCIGWQILADHDWGSCPELTVTEEGYGTLVVANHSNDWLRDVRLYYKASLDEPGIYIGGITYAAGIRELAPGQTVRLQPFHYACGYTKLIHCSADICPQGKH